MLLRLWKHHNTGTTSCSVLLELKDCERSFATPLRRSYYSRDINAFSAIEMRCIILRYINFLFRSDHCQSNVSRIVAVINLMSAAAPLKYLVVLSVCKNPIM